MILVDLNQVLISNLMAQTRGQPDKTTANEDMIRHMVINSLRGFNVKFKTKYGKMVLCSDAGDPWRRDNFPHYKYSRKKGREESTFDWDNIINVNLKTPFRITQIVSKSMKKNSYGRIINLGSIFSVISKSKRASYSSSKFGIIGLTKASALDLAEKNILVNSVSPGFVNTELTKTILKAKEMKKLKSEVPLKRLASPYEISNLILFLSSDLNTYLTGQNIIIDGGYSIR